MTAGDTAAISQGVGAFASRQAINAGNSAMIAGENVRQQIVTARGPRRSACRKADIDVEDGLAIARGGNKPSMSLRRAGADRPGHARLLVRAGTDAGP